MSAASSISNHGLYEPLNPFSHEIRIVELEPSAEYDSPIRCKLSKIDLLNEVNKGIDPISFEALSYTWGDVLPLRDITVNDMPFSVRANLESFLRHRRESQRSIYLWVDAICINQNNVAEKNLQIPRMSMVYVSAKDIVVWLGPASDDSELTIYGLRMLGADSPYDSMPQLTENLLKAVQKLFQRPWWTRVWTVQEIVIGGIERKLGNIRVQCGHDSVLWINIVVASARMKAYQDDMKQMFPNISNILELDSLRDNAHQVLLQSPSPTRTFDFICRYRHFEASDPRDKIYAISNMFAKSSSETAKARYDWPIEDVYLDFAVKMISFSGNLETLRHCGKSKRNLPSWVPDWTVSLQAQLLPMGTAKLYYDVPWWAETDRSKQNARTGKPSPGRYVNQSTRRDPVEEERARNNRLRRLKFLLKDSAP